MRPERSKEGQRPLGQTWLYQNLDLRVPPPATESYVVSGARRTETFRGQTREYYPPAYAVQPTILDNLRFALRREQLDPAVLVATLKALDPKELEDWVRREPTGAYSRRAWFLYERFVDERLALEDTRSGNYVAALDPRRYMTLSRRRDSARHRVVDNLLGGCRLWPVVRRTDKLQRKLAERVDVEARKLLASYDPVVLARAVNYLYTKETRSTFAIEGERPTAGRAERFITALKQAESFEPTEEDAFVRLQNVIVDPRYAEQGWRNRQNFVGETVAGYREEVHFICPSPDAVGNLMEGWRDLYQRVIDDNADPVVAAAVTSFAFVFIHPFEDGNGRIHRFLIHHVLARMGYSPPGVIFPVSAAILRDRRSYDEALESYSKAIMAYIDWKWTPAREIEVQTDTGDLYRYFDATSLAEYLYDRVVDTVRVDLREELGFVSTFDGAMQAVREVVDMPDRRASLLVRLLLQNAGRLSANKRRQFAELTDEEIKRLEAGVQEVMLTTDLPDDGAVSPGGSSASS